jgi:NAD(P)H:quinone oxidoreductase type IV
LSSTIRLTDTRNAWHRPLPKALGKLARKDIKRVPELVSEDVAKKSGYKLDQAAPIAAVAELPNYDAIIFGSGTRFGVVTSQMRNFLDQTGGLWAKGALVGKIGSVFTGSGTQHGGQESTILSMIPTLLHHGMIVVGLPYSFEGQSRHDEITGCSARPRLHDPMAAACPRRTNSPAHAFRAGMLRTSPASYRHEPFCPQRPRTSLELIARWISVAAAWYTPPNSASRPSPTICGNP